MAGVTNYEEIPLSIIQNKDGNIRINGAFYLKLTHYHIKPPTVFFG